MKKWMFIGSLGLAVAILLSLFAFSVFAKDEAASGLADVLGMTEVSLGDAVATAASHIGGTAIRAELEVENGHAQWAVVVAPDDGGPLKDVEVDAKTGAVLKVEDEDDSWDTDGDGDEDEDDEDEEGEDDD